MIIRQYKNEDCANVAKLFYESRGCAVVNEWEAERFG